MSNPNYLANLRNILAKLYPDDASMRRVASDAGLNTTRIAFGSSAINNWYEILAEAQRANQVNALLNVALHEYPTNQEFRKAFFAYRASVEQASTSDSTSSSDVNTGGGSYVGGNASTGGGDFIGRDKTTQGDEVKGDKVGRDNYHINAENVTIYQNPEGKLPPVTDKSSDKNEGIDTNPPIQPDSADKQIDIFISYSRIDAEVMRRLRADLQAAGFSVWTDDVSLEPGTPSWQRAIEAAIQAARCAIVLLSPEAKKSKWVEIEVSLAEDLGLRVFPLLVRGDDINAILFRLRTTQRIDLRDNWQAVKKQLIPALHRYLRPKPR